MIVHHPWPMLWVEFLHPIQRQEQTLIMADPHIGHQSMHRPSTPTPASNLYMGFQLLTCTFEHEPPTHSQAVEPSRRPDLGIHHSSYYSAAYIAGCQSTPLPLPTSIILPGKVSEKSSARPFQRKRTCSSRRARMTA